MNDEKKHLYNNILLFQFYHEMVKNILNKLKFSHYHNFLD